LIIYYDKQNSNNVCSILVHSIEEDIQPSPSSEDDLKDLETIERAYKNQIRLD